jgi:hypothetical protein
MRANRVVKRVIVARTLAFRRAYLRSSRSRSTTSLDDCEANESDEGNDNADSPEINRRSMEAMAEAYELVAKFLAILSFVHIHARG